MRGAARHLPARVLGSLCAVAPHAHCDPGGAGLGSLEITIDAVDAEGSARFWAAALGYRRLYERDPYVVLGPASGSSPPGVSGSRPQGASGPRVVVQRVAERCSGKSPVHLDLRVADPPSEVRRLVRLGARVERVVEEAGTQWTVMADPEGTPFCVCRRRSGPDAPVGPDGSDGP